MSPLVSLPGGQEEVLQLEARAAALELRLAGGNGPGNVGMTSPFNLGGEHALGSFGASGPFGGGQGGEFGGGLDPIAGLRGLVEAGILPPAFGRLLRVLDLALRMHRGWRRLWASVPRPRLTRDQLSLVLIALPGIYYMYSAIVNARRAVGRIEESQALESSRVVAHGRLLACHRLLFRSWPHLEGVVGAFLASLPYPHALVLVLSAWALAPRERS